MTSYWRHDTHGPHGYLSIIVTLLSQNVGANTSTFQISLGAYADANWGPSNASGISWSISGAGTGNPSGTFNLSVPQGGSQSIKVITATVAHGDAGGLSVTFTGTMGNTGTSVFGGSALSTSVTAVPPDIPRATVPVLSSSSFDAGDTITVSLPRASTSFTHNLSWSFGGLSQQTTGFSDATAVATSATLAIPLSVLAQIPNSASGTGTVNVSTYNGSNFVGSKSVPFTLKAGSGVVPTVGGITCTEAVSAVDTAVGAFVQKNSKLNVGMTGTAGVYGSTITGHKITVDGQTINAVSGTTGLVQGSGTLTITATVTDSRGRTGSASGTITVLPYSPPSVDTTATGIVRADSDGTTDAFAGTYLKVTLKGGVKSLKPASTEKNTLTYRVSTRSHGTGSYTVKAGPTAPGGITVNSTLTAFGTYDVAESWDVLIEVIDLFATTQYLIVVPTGTAILDLRPGGVGVMKRWEQGALDVNGDVYVSGEVTGADGTLSGTLRLPSTTDESATSTTHPFQIGADSGPNVRADNNQIDFYNNGAHAAANINTDTTGGAGIVTLGTSDGHVNVPGDLNAANIGLRESAGITSTATGGTTVTFPTGRFTQTPIVALSNGEQSTVGVARVTGRSTSGFTIAIFSLAGAAIAGTNVGWVAKQMTSGSASG